MRASQQLRELLSSPALHPNQVSPGLQQALGVPVVGRMVLHLRAQFGALKSVQQHGRQFEAHYERGTVPLQVAFDRDGRLAEFTLGPPRGNTPFLTALARLQAVSQELGLLHLKNGNVVCALEECTPFPVGSAFKLCVLDEAAGAVQRGELEWTSVLKLEERHRSLPTGLLQSWPVGSPLTVHTAATLMISQSDNTATELLVEAMGRDALEKSYPKLSPWLGTREYFILADDAHSDLRKRYLQSSAIERRAVLEMVREHELPEAQALFTTSPLHSENINWWLSPHDMCQVMSRVAHLPMLHVDPGPIAAEDWARVGFKGGSSPGQQSWVVSLEREDEEHLLALVVVPRRNVAPRELDPLARELVRGLSSEKRGRS